jgi:hypothetical protein
MESTKTQNSAALFYIFGVLWLVFAAGLLYYLLNQSASIQIQWDTATELQTAGFNLYRSPTTDGEFVRINDKMVPSQGDGLTGAAYTYRDDSVTAGETYYYLLEEVELDSSTNRYEDDILAYAVPAVRWWAVMLTAVSLLAGLALIIMGIREQKT